ncbi:MAG TPA: outer membrane beta-barrel protein [Pseudolabrys sp.]|nr:outer membrane beta-barrel protein [Pseudolabrys sp.]
MAVKLPLSTPATIGQADRTLMDFTGGISSLVQGRLGGTAANVSEMQVVSFAPTSASGRTNEAFAAISRTTAYGRRSADALMSRSNLLFGEGAVMSDRSRPGLKRRPCGGCPDVALMSSSIFSFIRRCVVLGTLLASANAGGAFATDLPPAMPTKASPRPTAVLPYNWSGFYLGGHLGHRWGRTRVEEDGVVIENGARTDGTVGGVLGGYNWQFGHALAGLEADFGWSNAHGVGTVLVTPVTSRGPNSYDVKWISHVRGRAGLAIDNWLFFIAGGLAAADLDFHEGTITTTFVPATGGKYYGWSLGGGAEWAFTPNLIGRAEYIYDNFGHKDYVGAIGDPYRIFLRGQTVRGAIAWKFNL